MVKIYLDDIRNPHQSGYKDSEWIVVRNYAEFVSAIEKKFSELEAVSLDHDLSDFDSDGNEMTGYSCVKWLCDYILDNNLAIANLELKFHTANPVGRGNMASYWNNFKNHYCATYLKE